MKISGNGRSSIACAALATALLLSACGGSDGGSGIASTPTPTPAPAPTPSPTPTPTPTPTPNTSLLSLTSSENFANDTASGTANFPVGPTSATSSLVSATIGYNLATQGYTVTVPGRAQTFLPADIDAAQTTSTLTVYVKRNGTTTDSLTLTKAGTSGRFTFQYVGGGYWQRTNNVPGAISGSFEAFAYGLPTAATAIPRTGRSNYAVDLLGIQTVSDNAFGITGSGTMQVDFATGQVITHGRLGSGATGDPVFTSEAVLSSSGNAINGNFRLDNIDGWQGTLSGRLYGPAAQEVGAAFQTRNASGQVAVGTIIGRGTATTSANTLVKTPSVNEFFANNAATLGTTLTGSSGSNLTTGIFSAGSAAALPLVVNYDASVSGYTVVASDRSQYFGQDRVGGPVFFDRSRGTTRETLEFVNWPISSGPQPPPLTNLSLLDGLQYVRAARWSTATGTGGSARYSLTDFAYGIRTPAGAVPRTGRGGFIVGISGTAADADFPNLMNFRGSGTMIADFAAGTLTGGGNLNFREDWTLSGRAPAQPTGTFALNTTISSSANAFNGAFTFNGIGNYAGTIAGAFYGPAAEEAGGAFSATDGSGGQATGTLVARRDPDLTATVPGLSEITTATVFGSPSRDAYVTYDPATQTYAYYFDNRATNTAAIAYRFAPAQIVAGQSNAVFTQYQGTGPAGQFNATDTYVIRRFNHGTGNTRLALTYTSFLDVAVTNNSGPIPVTTRTFTAFGNRTPLAQMPRTGSASFAGIATGRGTFGTPGPENSTFDGTSAVNADFAAGSFTSTLSLTARDNITGVLTPLSAMNYAGTINGNGFDGTITGGGGASGGMAGAFFGPGAAEFGATFGYNRFDGTTITTVQGVAVGKRP